jgi:hypothetical protein
MQAVPGGANYWDLGLLEGHARIIYFAENRDGEREEKSVVLPLPEETMDELEELLGDGRATLTVGKDLKTSEDFETAGSSCFLKLTVGQDLDSVLRAREIGTTLALAFAEQGYEQARYTLNRLCGRDVKAPPPLEITGGHTKEKKEKKGKTSGEPGRKQMRRPGALKGKNKPNFRR